jgi:hypothetical protein
MPNFKAARPKGQPRTLRTIAEDKGSAPAGRDPGMEIDPVAGVPMGYPGGGAGQRFADHADQAAPQGAGAKRIDKPKPYK